MKDIPMPQVADNLELAMAPGENELAPCRLQEGKQLRKPVYAGGVPSSRSE